MRKGQRYYPAVIPPSFIKSVFLLERLGSLLGLHFKIKIEIFELLPCYTYIRIHVKLFYYYNNDDLIKIFHDGVHKVVQN